MYAGSINNTNSMNTLIDSAQLLSENANIHFVLIGEGDQLGYLKKISKNLNNVTFIPKVKKSNLHLYLNKASCFVICWKNKDLYKYGVSPNKYGDYMKAGKPIIVATPFKKDPVYYAECGIITEPENPLALMEKIIFLSLKNKSYLNKLGENGYNYARKNLNYKKLASTYINFIQK